MILIFDLDVVLKGADPVGEPVNHGPELVSLAHRRHSLPGGAVMLTPPFGTFALVHPEGRSGGASAYLISAPASTGRATPVM